MIINTSTTVAYKCPSCGTFQFTCVSLFELFFNREHGFACRCNGSLLVAAKDTSSSYKFTIPCISCGTDHMYLVSRKELMTHDIMVFNCPETGMQQFFIGNDRDVREKIDNIEREFDELINMFGYDNYFKNTQVMFDSLNILHDIAEKGNLFCECGNKDIELLLLSDKIYLRCKKCPGSKIIYAASNEHLKENLLIKQILLFDEGQSLKIKNPELLFRKRDGK